MRLRICAVGRLRTGPEKTLIDDYLTRFDRTGRALSLGPAEVVEVDDRKGGGKSAVKGVYVDRIELKKEGN